MRAPRGMAGNGAWARLRASDHMPWPIAPRRPSRAITARIAASEGAPVRAGE